MGFAPTIRFTMSSPHPRQGALVKFLSHAKLLAFSRLGEPSMYCELDTGRKRARRVSW